MNKNLLKQLFPVEAEEVDMDVCPFCKRAIVMDDFRAPIDVREYKISGLCQSCIDEVFG